MSYAELADFRLLMEQAPAGSTEDARIQLCLDAATALIDTELGHDWAAGVVGTEVVYGDGSAELEPPAFVAGSVTAVSAPSGYSVPTYAEVDGRLVVADASGIIYRPPFYPYPWGYYTQRWLPGVPYTVSATYGWGEAPDDIKQACLEIAIAMYRGRDAGYSDVVGTAGSGGEIGYVGKYSKRADAILRRYRQAANPLRIA